MLSCEDERGVTRPRFYITETIGHAREEQRSISFLDILVAAREIVARGKRSARWQKETWNSLRSDGSSHWRGTRRTHQQSKYLPASRRRKERKKELFACWTFRRRPWFITWTTSFTRTTIRWEKTGSTSKRCFTQTKCFISHYCTIRWTWSSPSNIDKHHQ